MKTFWIHLAALGLAFCTAPVCTGQSDRPNILFIAVDDLKPMLGIYGDTTIQTPNIDRLGAAGTVFTNAHCQQAVCGPSRASLLTGKLPDTIKVWDLKTKIRPNNPGIQTLPEFLKNQNYETAAVGKIFDPRSVDGRVKHDANSWSISYIPSWNIPKDASAGKNVQGYFNPGTLAAGAAAAAAGISDYGEVTAFLKEQGATPAFESVEVPDDAYDDGAFTAHALNLMDRMAAGNKPFFLAVGYKKPHLPFNAPTTYWNLYDRASIDLAPFQERAEGTPSLAYHDGNELRSYSGIPKQGPLPEDLQRDLIHGYMACVSYIDTLIGRLLDGLEERGLAENTIVVLWGDHGWHLGDHGLWCKHSNFEQATRSPLILTAPGKPAGQISAAPVELMDLFPTLTDLAGLETPQDLQGTSLRPILADASATVKPAARSQFPRGRLMGYALRTDRYRYVAWVVAPTKQGAPAGTDIQHEELYDYEVDALETRNLATAPEYANTLNQLRALFQQGYAQGDTP